MLGDRRIDDAPRAEFLQQPLGHLVGALIFGDLLADDEDVAVAAHLLGHGVAQRFAHGHRDQLGAFGNVGRGDRGARGRFGESGLRRRRRLRLGRLDRRGGADSAPCCWRAG